MTTQVPDIDLFPIRARLIYAANEQDWGDSFIPDEYLILNLLAGRPSEPLFIDPETGFRSQFLGFDFGPNQRCKRCGGRGVWPLPRSKKGILEPGILCFHCFSLWHTSSGYFFKKHDVIDMRSKKRWKAAFDDFLTFTGLTYTGLTVPV